MSYFISWLKEASPQTKLWLEQENEFLKKVIEPNSILLDVGCGNGRNLKTIARLCKKAVGLDKNRKILEEARKNLRKFKNVELICANAATLPFKADYFDFVICMGNTFGIVYDKESVLREMVRVTKPGGKIVISVYNENALDTRIKDYDTAGHRITKIDKDGTIWTQEGLVSKQFAKNELEALFGLFPVKFQVTSLPIAYICLLEKRH